MSTRELLAHRPFRRLWLAQIISQFGDFVAMFAVQVAVVFRMHGSARDMTSVLLASLLPTALLGPVAGVFADRWDPRRTMIASDLTRGALIALLPFATTLPQIECVCFLVSCVSTFFAPAQTITVPLLVGRGGLAESESLTAASALMQQSMQLVRIASPAAASALVGSFGNLACYWADSLSFFFSASIIASISFKRPKRTGRGPRALGTELVQGVRFLLTNPKFSFVVLSMTAGTFATGCFGALASLYVRDLLHARPSLLGGIGSLIGVGTVTGAAVARKLTRRVEPAPLIGFGMCGVGVSILLLAAFPNRWVALSSATGIGLSVAVVMVAATAMLQGETPPEMRGRISSASASLASIAQAMAILFAGNWAAWIGIRGVFLLSAATLFATGVSRPAFRYFRRETDLSVHEACAQTPR